MEVFSKPIQTLLLRESYHLNKLIGINEAYASTVDLMLKKHMELKKKIFLIKVYIKRRGEYTFHCFSLTYFISIIMICFSSHIIPWESKII